MTNWDKRFVDLAAHVSEWSKDPSTQVGAVITREKFIVSVGFNGFPRGIEDTRDRLSNRDTKIKMVIHAETNAILTANQDLHGCTIYTYPLPPCSNCAAAIIQSGITRVVSSQPKPGRHKRWSCDLSIELFEEAGIEFFII